MALLPVRCCPYCFRLITGEEIHESDYEYSSFPKSISDRSDLIECRRSTIKTRMLLHNVGCLMCKRKWYGPTDAM